MQWGRGWEVTPNLDKLYSTSIEQLLYSTKHKFVDWLWECRRQPSGHATATSTICC